MHERYGLLRAVISKDKRTADKIFIPIYSNDLKFLEDSYNYFIKENNNVWNNPVFNEVAIFDYEKIVYIKNNFKERDFFVNNVRR